MSRSVDLNFILGYYYWLKVIAKGVEIAGSIRGVGSEV